MFRSVLWIAVRSRAGPFRSVVRNGFCCVPERPPDRVPEHRVVSLVKAALMPRVVGVPRSSSPAAPSHSGEGYRSSPRSTRPTPPSQAQSRARFHRSSRRASGTQSSRPARRGQHCEFRGGSPQWRMPDLVLGSALPVPSAVELQARSASSEPRENSSTERGHRSVLHAKRRGWCTALAAARRQRWA
jgi:hypothetical protein